MMKFNIIAILALCLFSGAGLLTAEENYDDLKAFLKETIILQEEYAASLERINSVPELKDAIKNLGEKMEGLYLGKMRVLAKKYPGINMDDPPLQIKAEVDRLNAVSERVRKLMNEDKKRFFDDPEVGRLMRELGDKLDSHIRRESFAEEQKK